MTLALTSCEFPSALTKEGVEPYEALPVYPEFWSATEACSGRSGDVDLIRWFRATGISAGLGRSQGLWEPPHDITVLRGLEEDEGTVRHEMLHDLLRGDPDHRSPTWEACGLAPQ
ncbi:MAG: hypothetical protein HKO53_12345 [Gemmatimonadetes bacterium]|nr:hypothetical protein [Gemmatimonadota bacterium]